MVAVAKRRRAGHVRETPSDIGGGGERRCPEPLQRPRPGALTLSADGLILYSNRRFAELIGLPLEQVSGTFLGAYAAERDGERVTAMLRRQANGTWLRVIDRPEVPERS